MIKEKNVKVKINISNKKYYEKLTQKKLKPNQEILVNVEDLTSGSHVLITQICDRCGEEKTVEYKTYLSKVIKSGACYCRQCAMERLKENIYIKYGVENVFQLQEIQEKIAQTNLERYGHKYIMQNAEYKEKYLKGKNNHFYVDGRNSLHSKRNNSQLKSWRREVYLKNDYSCVICGANTKLRAHHLESYDNNENLRYDVDNGITLCDKHHKQFHNIYGYGNNTLQQFLEFLQGQTTMGDECNPVE